MELTNEATFETAIWYRPLQKWQKSWSGWLTALFAVAAFVFILAQIFEWGDLKQISAASDAMQAAISLASVLLAWRVSRHPALDETTRRAWRVAMLAFFSYAVGHNLWFYFSSILGIEPFPSQADAGFLGFYPLMLWALLSFPTAAKNNRSERLKFVMDAAIVMLGGATAVWHFIIQPTIAAITDDFLTPTLNLAYTVGDMVLLLGIVTILLRRVAEINRVALLIIVVGLINIAIADLGFALFTLQGTYYSGHWIDNFFITGILMFLAASHYQYQHATQTAENPSNETSETTRVTAFSWLPYLAVALGFGMLLLETRSFWAEPLGIIVFAALGLTGLVVVRQIAAVKENVRLLAEQTARESELKFRSLVQHSSDMIVILDGDGTIRYQSPSVEAVLGYADNALVGRHALEFSHAEELRQVKDDFKAVLKDSNAVLKREHRFKHADGSWRVLEGIAKFFHDETDRGSDGILMNLRDVTDRKRAENQLRAYTSKLQASNRELQDFAFVASHDLQEPLRKVQAFGDRLKMKCADNLPADGRDYLERMQSAANRMQILINDLLSFSRVTTKAQPFAKVNLSKIAREVLSDLEVKIEESDATIETADLPTIEADAMQIRQLVQNLVGNALKFRRADVAPVVKIYAEADAPKDFCRLVVEDNGIGFDEKYTSKIFTVFQRLHAAEDYAGSGVGLAVCRKIVERHNGQITVQSKPNKGAKFTITLPLKQIEEENLHETI